MKRIISCALLLSAIAAGTARAESEELPKPTNAALGYWRAFSQMEMKDLDPATTKALTDVSSGLAAWDEKALRPLLDRNAGALTEFHRAAEKPECDFGLEFGDGFAMVLPHLAKARGLGRLAAIEAASHAAAGNGEKAVSGWLDGMALARHLANDQILISLLVARAIWHMHAEGLLAWLASGNASAKDLQRIEESVAAAPVGGFDWSTGLRAERLCALLEFDRIAAAANPAAALRDLGSEIVPYPTDGKPLTDEQLAEAAETMGVPVETLKSPDALRKIFGQWKEEYRVLLTGMEAALRLPPWEAQTKLEDLMRTAEKSNVLVKMLVPALGQVGETRRLCEAERAGLLGVVKILRKGAEDLRTIDGLGIPPDPFTGRPFDLRLGKDTIELWSAGKDRDGKDVVFRVKR